LKLKIIFALLCSSLISFSVFAEDGTTSQHKAEVIITKSWNSIKLNFSGLKDQSDILIRAEKINETTYFLEVPGYINSSSSEEKIYYSNKYLKIFFKERGREVIKTQTEFLVKLYGLSVESDQIKYASNGVQFRNFETEDFVKIIYATLNSELIEDIELKTVDAPKENDAPASTDDEEITGDEESKK
jgi:hypothetical protein